MAEGVNESLKESSDLLAKALEYLTGIEQKIKELPKGVKDTKKEVDGLASSLNAASTGGAKRGFLASLIPWTATFGSKTAPAAGGGAAGGGGGGTTAVAAAPGPSQGPTGRTAMGIPIPSFGNMSPNAQAATVAGVGVAASVGAAAWSGTPGVADAVTRQAGLFPMAFSMASPSNPVTGDSLSATNQRLRGLLGDNLSGIFDAEAAANLTRYRGFGMNTPYFDQNMRAAGSMYAITGMSNPAAMGGITSLYGPQISSSLAGAGVFTNDLTTGAPKDIGQIVDELWTRGGWDNKNISMADFETQLGGGALGADLRKHFGSDPSTYAAIVEAFKLKVQTGGRQGITWGGDPNDPNNAQNIATQMGIELAPQHKLGQTTAQQRNLLDEASPGLYSGFEASQTVIQNFNSAITEATKALGPLADAAYAVKGGVQDFTASGEGQSVVKIISAIGSLLSGGNPLSALGTLMASGGDASGHVGVFKGSSTSDSVPAMLSRGEYIINARAAQEIGIDNLDAMNSLGHALGSAFASPAKHFARGGDASGTSSSTATSIDGASGETTLQGWPALLSSSTALGDFTVGSHSVRLRKDYAPMLIRMLTAYNNDPNLGPITDLSGYEYRDGAMGGGKSDHAAGIAVDIDPFSGKTWGMPPGTGEQPVARQPTAAEMSAIRNILMSASYMEWGGDWSGGSYDPMHWQIASPNIAPEDPGAIASTSSTNDQQNNTSTSSTAVPSSGVSIGSDPSSLMNPMLAAFGIGPRWARATSVSPYGRTGGNGMMARISNMLLPNTTNSGSAITLYGTTATGGVSQSSSGSDSAPSEQQSNLNFNTASGGKGPEWLYQFLVEHGLRGQQLHTWWTIGMRESGGDPSNTTHGGNEDWTSSGEPHYDVGLFQVNNTHLDNIRSVFGSGSTMQMMLDPNKNFEYTMHLSSNGTNLTPWALEPDGQTFNFSQYSSDWISKYGEGTQQNHADWWSKFDGYNKYSYSEGAYRTHEGPAKLHEGELVMPALAAEEFRKMMREAVSGGSSSAGNVYITLTIARASETEAVRFANRVKEILKDDQRITTMRSR